MARCRRHWSWFYNGSNWLEQGGTAHKGTAPFMYPLFSPIIFTILTSHHFFFFLAVLDLSCSMHDLVPWPGIKPQGLLTTGPPGKSTPYPPILLIQFTSLIPGATTLQLLCLGIQIRNLCVTCDPYHLPESLIPIHHYTLGVPPFWCFVTLSPPSLPIFTAFIQSLAISQMDYCHGYTAFHVVVTFMRREKLWRVGEVGRRRSSVQSVC